jgi:hypothetical protein
MKPEIEEFLKALVLRVRDESIRSCDRQLLPGQRTVAGRRWNRLAADSPGTRMVVCDTVDMTLLRLLIAIDGGILDLKVVGSSGQEVSLPEDGLGELAGWYLGTGGFVPTYSTERYSSYDDDSES